MKVEKLGEGEPEYTVVGSQHGDEPCGKRAIEKFLSEDRKVEKPVQFIIANERALEEGERFVDADLNRSFPGNPESENHEERLASRIMERVEGTEVLDLHSTKSHPEPFGIIDGSPLDEEVSACRYMGLENVVYSPEKKDTLVSRVKGLNVECGHQGSREAAENAYRVICKFLAYAGAISMDLEPREPRFFRSIEEVEGDWKFVAENFKKVEKGEVYAEKDEEELVAEEEFYPVLMSTNGYDGMLGIKAKKLEN